MTVIVDRAITAPEEGAPARVAAPVIELVEMPAADARTDGGPRWAAASTAAEHLDKLDDQG